MYSQEQESNISKKMTTDEETFTFFCRVIILLYTMPQAHKIVHNSLSPPFGQQSASFLSSHWKYVTNLLSPKWALLERCVHMMCERQLYLKFVGPFVAIHFYIPINKVIRCYQASFMTWCFCLFIILSFWHFLLFSFCCLSFWHFVFLSLFVSMSFCLLVLLSKCILEHLNSS